MVIRVSDALVANAVVVGPAWSTFADAVHGLVNQLVAADRLPKALAAQAVHRVTEREAVASTAMVDIGVSIPHARVDGIPGIVSALAVAPHAVYQVADRLPISTVALVLSSPSLTGEHLNFLAALSMLLQSGRVRQQLRQAKNGDEVMRLICSHEQTRS